MSIPIDDSIMSVVSNAARGTQRQLKGIPGHPACHFDNQSHRPMTPLDALCIPSFVCCTTHVDAATFTATLMCAHRPSQHPARTILPLVCSTLQAEGDSW
jgi:hypothetical protein